MTTFERLLKAYRCARRGNMSNETVCRFDFQLENELLRLQWELSTDRYTPTTYTYFTVHDPKKRRIAAPHFRDRIVHHTLVKEIEPFFERSFIADTYACRIGKGTHYGARRMKSFLMAATTQHGTATPLYYLQCDIRKFFPSISWDVLLTAVDKKIRCPRTLALIEKIITIHHMKWGKGERAESIDEIVSLSQRKGLPIGNLTSQLFANVYLNPLDHFIKEELREKWYSRYMDDFIILSPDKDHLKQTKNSIQEFIGEKLRLTIHPHKSIIQSTHNGVPFLGYRIFPYHMLIRGKTLGRFQKRFRKFRRRHTGDSDGQTQIRNRINSFNGHLNQANTWNLRKSLFVERIEAIPVQKSKTKRVQTPQRSTQLGLQLALPF